MLAAAALCSIGGQMQGRLVFSTDDERGRAAGLGITDLDHKYTLAELASGDVIFTATGVTDGTMLDGVRPEADCVMTHSLVMRSRTRTMRWIKTRHDTGATSEKKPRGA